MARSAPSDFSEISMLAPTMTSIDCGSRPASLANEGGRIVKGDVEDARAQADPRRVRGDKGEGIERI